MIKTPVQFRKWDDLTEKHHKRYPEWSPKEIKKVLYNPKIFLAVTYKTDGKAEVSQGYPIGFGVASVQQVMPITVKQADNLVKEPFNTMVELFGKEKTKGYLSTYNIKAQVAESTKLREIIRELVVELLSEEDDEEELDEMSVTGDIAGYETPKAFSGGRKEKTRQNSEKLGYKLVWSPEEGDTDDLKVPKRIFKIPKLVEGVKYKGIDIKKQNVKGQAPYIIPAFERVAFSMKDAKQIIDKELEKKENLSEGKSKYYEFKTDETLSPRQKVGHSLRIVRKSLSEAEKLIDMNLRLKKEAGLQSKDYWKRTHEALTKIDERLVRLIGKVKNFRD